MASNDMNSWDEDPDERLRQRWQQTFADFEIQPRSSLGRRILDQLPTQNRRRPIRWVLGGLMLLVSAGLLYKNRVEKNASLSYGVMAGQPTVPAQPLSAEPAPLPTASARQSAPTELPVVSLVPSVVVARQPTVHPPTAPRMETPLGSVPGAAPAGVATVSGHPVTTRQWPAAQIPFRPWGASSGANYVASHQSRAKLVRPVGNRIATKSFGPAEPVADKPMTNRLDRSIHSAYDPAPLPVDQPPANTVPIECTRLKPLGILAIPGPPSILPSHLPAIRWGTAHSVESVIDHTGPHWFVELMPLSSFQWMSASPTAAYLSHVDAPAAFSPASWGYQLNGGLRFQRWRANLSVGQLRRWAYYTVNENRYRVDLSATNPHQLVRETHAVAENELLPMIGGGLSQERLLAQGRYTVELGGQVWYLPTDSQLLVGLRAGTRRRLAVSRTMELQIGLTAEYGLNRLLSDKQQLVIHPLVVGLGLRIQPRSGHP